MTRPMEGQGSDRLCARERRQQCLHITPITFARHAQWQAYAACTIVLQMNPILALWASVETVYGHGWVDVRRGCG